jgi:hypothetical protein
MSLRGVNATTIIVDDFEPATRHIATFTRDSKLLIDKTPYHYANPIMYSFAELEEMAEWCYDTFGPQGYNQSTMQSAWDFQNDPDYIFWFREEKHLMMFILRWS